MKTLELVQSYLKNRPELTQKDALQYFRSHEHHGNEEVPQAISNFFANLANHQEIKKRRRACQFFPISKNSSSRKTRYLYSFGF